MFKNPTDQALSQFKGVIRGKLGGYRSRPGGHHRIAVLGMGQVNGDMEISEAGLYQLDGMRKDLFQVFFEEQFFANPVENR